MPRKYQGEPETAPRTELNRAMRWLSGHWDELSAEKQARVEPYIVSPDDPKYFLNLNKKESNLWHGKFIHQAQAASNWQRSNFNIQEGNLYLESIGQIYYHSGEEQAAQRIRTAALKAWPMYVNLLGKSMDKTIKIYFTNMSRDYEVTVWRSPHNGAQSCEIKINNKASMAKDLEATTVHELFHCFQFNLDKIYRYNFSADIDWIMEATATWSEDFVYPKKNSEHQYLSGFFDDIFNDLVSTSRTKEYSSYLWFFFLSQHLGQDNHIKKVLTKSVNGKVKKAIQAAVADYSDVFAEFGAWN